MKMGAQKYVRTCVFAVPHGSNAPPYVRKILRQPEEAHSVRLRRRCAVAVGGAAGRAGRAVWGKCMQIRMQGAGGASMKHYTWVVW